MAKYSNIKGFTVQTLSTDTVASSTIGGSWASGGSLNNARSALTGSGTQTAGLAMQGELGPPSTYEGTAEEYNGSSWTNAGEMNTARAQGAASKNGSQTATISFVGRTAPGAVALNESYNGSSWTEVGDVNTAVRAQPGGTGTSTAALKIGGAGPPIKADVESWDGSSWTEIANLNGVKFAMGSAGIQTASLVFGGAVPAGPGLTGQTEQWNGSSWTELSDMNTAREYVQGNGLYTDALGYGGSIPSPQFLTLTEFWNGSSWTEVADLSNGVSNAAGAGSTGSDLGLNFGGALPSYSTVTEEWTAPSVFSKITEGQLYFNSTTNTFKETISDVPGTSWSSGTNLNQARAFNNAAGSIPSAITFGGQPAPTQAYAEQWNGSAWTEVADLNEGRVGGAGGGASGTDAIMAGGYELPNVGNSVNTEIWNGSAWTEVNNLNAQKYTAGSAIPVSTSGFAFGGNPSVATAEVWDGTNWTEVSDLNTARMYLAGFGSATSAIAGNGIDPSASPPTYLQNKVEKWDGSSWTEVAEYNTARVENLQGQGSSNAAGIVAGGGTTGSNQIANTEIWNGTSWTEANDLATARKMGGQIGSTTNGMYVGGSSPSDSTTVEHWESGLANKTITAS